jgi:predicted kinase
MLVLVCGLPSTGKSTVAKQIAEDFNGKILRTDVIRRELFKKATLEDVMKSDTPMIYNLEEVFDAQDTIPDKYQEMIWEQKKEVYDELFHQITIILEKGEDVVLDGTFYERRLRERIYSIAEKTSTHVFLIECHCSEKIIRERLATRKNVPDDASYVDRLQIYLKLKEVYEKPICDKMRNFVSIIFYDTGLQKIESQRSAQGSVELNQVINSVKKLINKSR